MIPRCARNDKAWTESSDGLTLGRMRRQHRYYVYLMASHSGTLYVGITNNIRRRVLEHAAGEGSTFTARYGVHRLVYYEVFQYVGNAIAREKEIKGWRRSKKEALIRSLNPGWRDLARDFGKEFAPVRCSSGKSDSSLRSE